MVTPVPDSGQLDAFGEAEYVLPAGTVVHRTGTPVRLRSDTDVATHRENAKLVKAHKRMVQEGRKGPEIHSAKAHRCVDKVRAKGHAESNAWAICTASIGKRGVYAKGHGGNANPKSKVKEAREAARARALKRAAEAGFSNDPPGSGGRFKACLASGKSRALCASIGRKKYGKKGMARMAAAGRRRAAGK